VDLRNSIYFNDREIQLFIALCRAARLKPSRTDWIFKLFNRRQRIKAIYSIQLNLIRILALNLYESVDN